MKYIKNRYHIKNFELAIGTLGGHRQNKKRQIFFCKTQLIGCEKRGTPQKQENHGAGRKMSTKETHYVSRRNDCDQRR